MNKEEFLKKLQDVLERDEKITENMVLSDIEEWDSLSAMALMAFFDKTLNKTLLPAEVREMKTVSDIINKAGI